MDIRKRIGQGRLALLAALTVLALIVAMLIINAEVGLWEWGARLDPVVPAGEIGSGLHLGGGSNG